MNEAAACTFPAMVTTAGGGLYSIAMIIPPAITAMTPSGPMS